MLIIDAFIFYNEIDLLLYRLSILNDVVDYFILIESKYTFVGKEKNLFYEENKHMFSQFHNKIKHIILDDAPHKYGTDKENYAWENEIFQRNFIIHGLNEVHSLLNFNNNDFVIIADLDEIPDPRTLLQIKNLNNLDLSIYSFEMDVYMYNLNTIDNRKWYRTKLITVEYIVYSFHQNIHCHDLRLSEMGLPKVPIIKSGGWHLSYLGDANFIKNKLENFSHQEYNFSEFTNLDKIQDKINNSASPIGHPCNYIKIIDNHYLPVDYDKYLIKYFKLDD